MDLVATQLAGHRIGAPSADLVLVEWRDAGGGGLRRYIAPLHVHHEDDEAWYVVSGALGVRVGDEEVRVAAGGAVLVPRGTPHTYWNADAGETRYVLAMTQRIERLIAALHAIERPSAELVAAVFREHRSEYLGWPPA